MGFSVSASTAIIFAGLFLTVGVLYPAMSNGYELVQDAEVDREDAHLEMRNSEINITRLDGEWINVTNEGSTALDASTVDVVVSGQYRDRDSYTTRVDDDTTTELWLPGETLSIQSSDVSAGSNDRVQLVTDHGLSVSGEI